MEDFSQSQSLHTPLCFQCEPGCPAPHPWGIFLPGGILRGHPSRLHHLLRFLLASCTTLQFSPSTPFWLPGFLFSLPWQHLSGGCWTKATLFARGASPAPWGTRRPLARVGGGLVREAVVWMRKAAGGAAEREENFIKEQSVSYSLLEQ